MKPDYRQIHDQIYRGDYIHAENSLKNLLAINHNDLNALNLLGTLYLQQNHLVKALEVFKGVWSISPNNFSVAYNIASILMSTGRHSDAISFHKCAIELDPNSYWARNNYAISLHKLNQHEDALVELNRAIHIDPSIGQAWSNYANVLQLLGRFEEALTAYDKALSLNSIAYPEAWSNRGVVLKELKQYPLALESFERSLQIKSDYPEAWFNKGIVYAESFKNQDALACFEQAVKLRPNYFEAYLNIALTYCESQDHVKAMLAINQALEINSLYQKAWYQKGVIAHQLQQYDVASSCFKRANELDPNYEYLLGNLLSIQLHLCDWTNLEQQTAQFITKAFLGEKVAPPFHAIPLIDSGLIQKQIAQTWIADKHAPTQDLPPLEYRPVSGGRKIRLGYYSADFHNHATMYLMAKLFEMHDRSRFELFAFSFGPTVDDAMRRRAMAAFDHFMDVKEQSDLEIAQLSRDLEIDIAVDLKGFTPFARTNIFAHRAAPIQVNYLGYPGTMGAPYIDYIIADHILVPPGSEQFYTEKVAYMPHSYQVNDDERVIADTVYTRAQMGLPETGFIFCCFNNNYKILPPTLEGWIRILNAVPGSVLWLLEDNPTAGQNLRQAFAAGGLNPDRLIFAKRLPLAEHLARHRLADLFLDTLPCNAHTTTSDALWAGLPVLTLAGEAFAGRVSASLLNAIGLPDLIVTTQAQYEQKAVEIAQNPEKLGQIKKELIANRSTHPLFNTTQYTKELERVYLGMVGVMETLR
jgi:predicted O-linked N-acetylglucosamine transferase (SPINDLY family)